VLCVEEVRWYRGRVCGKGLAELVSSPVVAVVVGGPCVVSVVVGGLCVVCVVVVVCVRRFLVYWLCLVLWVCFD